LIKIKGRGNFEGDSRYWIDPPDGIRTIDLFNNKDIDSFLREGVEIIDTWLKSV
jgi:hypothetical protein